MSWLTAPISSGSSESWDVGDELEGLAEGAERGVRP